MVEDAEGGGNPNRERTLRRLLYAADALVRRTGRECGFYREWSEAERAVLAAKACFEQPADRSQVVADTVTGNAQLLLGYVTGLVMKANDAVSPTLYVLTEVNAAAGTMMLTSQTGNTYRLSIVQTGGVE